MRRLPPRRRNNRLRGVSRRPRGQIKAQAQSITPARVVEPVSANIESSRGDHGTTLMVAYSGGRLSVAQMLAARDAKVFYTAADGTSFSAFVQAKSFRHRQVAGKHYRHILN